MIVLRNKEFSMGGDIVYDLYNNIDMPQDFVDIPKILVKYMKSTISKDFYKLLEKMDLLEHCPLPICYFGGDIEEHKYFPCFYSDLEMLNLGKPCIYFDLKGKLYKKTGLIFHSYKEMSEASFKEWLMEELNNLLEDDWIEDQDQVMSQNSSLISKIQQNIRRL